MINNPLISKKSKIFSLHPNKFGYKGINKMRTLRKRRKQRKTDYGKRLKLLKSGLPRIAFRKTNKYVNSQYVESKEARDKVLLEVSSKKLLNYGWPKEQEGSLKTIPAAYLTGFLMGKKILKRKLPQKIIIDSGMIIMKNKTKPFAFIKGLIDSGINITCKEDAFPEEDRITGKSLKKDFSEKFNEIKLKIEEKEK